MPSLPWSRPRGARARVARALLAVGCWKLSAQTPAHGARRVRIHGQRGSHVTSGRCGHVLPAMDVVRPSWRLRSERGWRSRARASEARAFRDATAVQRAAALVSASEFEGSGFRSSRPWAVGCPVAASPADAVVEVLGGCGLVSRGFQRDSTGRCGAKCALRPGARGRRV